MRLFGVKRELVESYKLLENENEFEQQKEHMKGGYANRTRKEPYEQKRMDGQQEPFNEKCRGY